jgi:hypothetical protein
MRTKTSLLLGSCLALALAAVIWSPAHAQQAVPSDGVKITDSQMMERCSALMAQKRALRDDVKAQDALTTTALAEMNRAPESQKLDLLAGLVTRLTEQRIALDARRATIEDEMMKHMMQHGQMGKDSMPKCPMMKDVDGK